MESRDVRRNFLQFFAERGHQVVPSSPLVLPRDPTLLFANAGMNQFKGVFLGRETRPYRRATSVQKCLRVSGKHNDLEEVGRTPRHHTFFEMLGNFSFGDYFKREAIAWAWELVTGVYGIPAERLWATVFAGDAEFPADEEAARLWVSETDLPAGRVIALGRKENFWQMGDTGPAGPCTELHVDLRPGDKAGGTPETDPDRFLEIWNLVFMQYDLQPDGSARQLPAPSVDTGAGLERLAAVLQGVSSNYDTDLFLPILRPLAQEAGVEYGEDGTKDVSLRVIADHLRAITALVAEGIIPGPEKRGAVLRRILRRALRHGRLLGLPVPFLHRHVGHVVEVLGEAYPEFREQQELVERIVRREEERFDRTLAAGFELLEERIEELLARGERTFPGEEAFVLESERGLPLDLVRDALEERGLALDEAGWAAARRRHVEASRVAGSRDDAGATAAAAEAWVPWRGRGSRFTGYGTLETEAARVLGVFRDGVEVDALGEGETGEVILDETPFYAESGGQVGDRGRLAGGEVRARVVDTFSPAEGVILHRVRVESGSLAPGVPVVAAVDPEHRAAVRRHHTATHLLHAALRRILGTHVRQAGSLVAPDRLRFDFSHYEAVDDGVRREIEAWVTARVVEDLPVETVEVPLEEALSSGAIAFFGDRYGERVRVVRIGDASLELCGGTHCARTGEIGPFLVLSERGVAAGVRRIEAVAGPAALARVQQWRASLDEAARALGTSPGEVPGAVARRLEEGKRLAREAESLRLELARARQGGDEPEEVGGLRVLARRVDGLGKGPRRELADQVRQRDPAAVVVLGAADGGKAQLLVALGEKARERLDARALVRELAARIGGGGGGRPDLAEAGGRDPGGLDRALAEAPGVVRNLLGT